MFVFEAKRMGYHVVVLDPKLKSPAGQVADEQIVAGFDEISAYHELAEKTDVMTFEFEHIKEVSIVVIKNDSGVSFYPVVENIHQNSILIKTLVPAPLSNDVIQKIHDTSLKIVEELDDYGVYCIEFFVDNQSEVIVNEIAPRPHNSGHYTIEGCVTSHYEQLVRVVCGMPIGSTHLRKPCAMYNILGNEESQGKYVVRGLDKLLSIPDWYHHCGGWRSSSSSRDGSLYDSTSCNWCSNST